MIYHVSRQDSNQLTILFQTGLVFTSLIIIYVYHENNIRHPLTGSVSEKMKSGVYI